MDNFKFMISTDAKTVIAGWAIVLAGTVAFYLRKSRRDPGIESFPGPKPNFLLGNIRQFPSSHWTDAFNAWQREYGDIVYLSLPRIPVLILSSLEDVEELLGKRANIWSGRTGNPMVSKVMDFGWSIVQSQPTPEFYGQRKVFRKVIGPNSVGDYDQLIEKEAEELLRGLAAFTGDPLQHIERCVGKVIITVAYGERVFKEKGEELIRLNSEAVDLITYTFSNIWLPNIIPLTRFLPSWIPGLRFPAVGQKGKAMFREIRYSPFNMVKDAMEHGKADFSVISKYLSDSEFSSKYLPDAVAMMYFAAVETTTTAVYAFICNMLMFPDVQKRIQKELDDVIGRGNSPNMAGVQSCSLLQAAWKESLRFSPPAPTGIPHVSSTDDHWKGRFIPKGTLVLQNIIFILHDPRLWGNDAHEFKPERFLPEFNPRAHELPDVGSIPFGFGRRICPGRYLAERNGTLFIAAILAAYDIVPPAGEPVPMFVEFTGTQIRRPSNLQVFFSPRKSA